MTTTVAAKIRVQKITEWPNRLGFDCTVNNCKFQVTNDREIGRLSAWRIVNGELHVFAQIVEHGEWVDGLKETAELVYRVYRDCPELWTE